MYQFLVCAHDVSVMGENIDNINKTQNTWDLREFDYSEDLGVDGKIMLQGT